MTKMAKYDESSIQIAEGLEGVRVKPAMYIGDGGVFHILREIVDNAIDEAQAGHNDEVGVAIDGDVYYIWDKGRGIPCGKHPKYPAKSTMEIIFTMLHAGGKLKAGTAYASSGGTHGVGASVTNALSQKLEVSTFRDGKWNYMAFSKGKMQIPLKQSRIKIPFITNQPATGTVVKFTPDRSLNCFKKHPPIKADRVTKWLEVAAYVVPKTTFIVVDNKKQYKFYQPKGMIAYLDHLAKNSQISQEDLGPVFSFSNPQMDIVLSWAQMGDEIYHSFVNVIETNDGGTHVNGLNQAISSALKSHELGRHKNTNGTAYRSDDLRTGLICAINFRMQSPEFGGQVKDRLVSADVTEIVKKAVLPELSKFFDKNKAHAKEILDRALGARKAAETFKRSKEALSKIKSPKGKNLLPEKLVISTGKNIADRELFLVEGDSAGGTAKSARNKLYQEILPLSGKFPNAHRDKSGKIFSNSTVLDILGSIGYEPKGDDPLKKLRVGKIILLPDADEDGQHINALILTLFQTLMPGLIEKGMVYIVETSLYTASYRGKTLYGSSLNDLIKQNPNIQPKNITRIKGWGEINGEDLEKIALDPKSRKLKRVLPIKTKEDIVKFDQVMGSKSDYRKVMLGLV